MLVQESSQSSTVYPIERPDSPKNLSFSRDNLGIFEALFSKMKTLAHHPTFKMIGDGTASRQVHENLLLHYYPLVENFPKFMALCMSKTHIEEPWHEDLKDWLITNIKVEKNHARWFLDWANGIGLPSEKVIGAKVFPECEAIVNYLWSKSTHGSIAVGLGAVNLGIEWMIGEWASYAINGVPAYFDRGIASGKPAAVARWLKVHASYDDLHPYEAMDFIVKCAKSDEDLKDAMAAAERSMEIVTVGLDACLTKH